MNRQPGIAGQTLSDEGVYVIVHPLQLQLN
jgi:hypothetical protein